MTVRRCGMMLVGLSILLMGRGGQALSAHDALASRDDNQQLQYNGVLNDHSIAMAGSWEVHGVWTLNLKGNSGKADFSAAVTMERADLWFVTTQNPPADPNSLAARN